MIRRWEPDDAPALLPLVLAFLTEHAAAGGDILPTEENAVHLVAIGMAAAAAGDPVFLADEDGLVGFVLWVGVPHGVLTFRERVCQGLGTYVVPEHRREHLAKTMREVAVQQARVAGYTRVDGVARDKRGLESGKAGGFVPSGVFCTIDLKENA